MASYVIVNEQQGYFCLPLGRLRDSINEIAMHLKLLQKDRKFNLHYTSSSIESFQNRGCWSTTNSIDENFNNGWLTKKKNDKNISKHNFLSLDLDVFSRARIKSCAAKIRWKSRSKPFSIYRTNFSIKFVIIYLIEFWTSLDRFFVLYFV